MTEGHGEGAERRHRGMAVWRRVVRDFMRPAHDADRAQAQRVRRLVRQVRRTQGKLARHCQNKHSQA